MHTFPFSQAALAGFNLFCVSLMTPPIPLVPPVIAADKIRSEVQALHEYSRNFHVLHTTCGHLQAAHALEAKI